MKIKALDKLFWFTNNWYEKVDKEGNQEYRSILVIGGFLGAWLFALCYFFHLFIRPIPDWDLFLGKTIPNVIPIILCFIYFFYINHYESIINYYNTNNHEIKTKNYKIFFFVSMFSLFGFAALMGFNKLGG